MLLVVIAAGIVAGRIIVQSPDVAIDRCDIEAGVGQVADEIEQLGLIMRPTRVDVYRAGTNDLVASQRLPNTSLHSFALHHSAPPPADVDCRVRTG